MHKQRLTNKNMKQTIIWQEYILECNRAIEHEQQNILVECFNKVQNAKNRL
jgi:hypothetical protein